MPLLKNGFLEKIETWHVGLSCQYTHFMSFSSKSEHVTIADQATLIIHHKATAGHFAQQYPPRRVKCPAQVRVCTIKH